MKYNKPRVIAKNGRTGKYAAGCPAKGRGATNCTKCFRVK